MNRGLSAGDTPPPLVLNALSPLVLSALSPFILSTPAPFSLRYRRVCQMRRQGISDPPRMSLYRVPITPYQRLLLRPRPALDLLLESDCTLAGFKVALPLQLYRFSGCRVSNLPRKVLLQSRLHAVGMAAVVRTVRATQEIDGERFHGLRRKGLGKLSPNG